MNTQTVVARDGVQITAQFYGEDLADGKIRGAVLIASAMGTPQTYYASFAAWLASRGFIVATFDYRGTGQSRPARLRGFRTDIFEWAGLDCAAMIEALGQRAPHRPLYWIGHSLGGQILPFVPNHRLLSKAVTVACGSGYWRENAAPLKRRAWWVWFVVAPIAVRLFGYFPGKRLRKIGDLPRDVMIQWRRWCLHPEYAMSEGEKVRAQYAAVTTPIVALSFEDDEFMSARNTESIHGFYVSAQRTIKRIAPRQIGVRRIGHFGFFRSGFERSLWEAYLLPELS